MPRRGEYRRSRRSVPRAVTPPRVGLRRVVAAESHGESGVSILDPSRFTCAGLAAELADEWVDLAATGELAMGTIRCYRRAVVEFCRYVDQTTPDARAASLSHATPDLLAAVLEWTRLLPAGHRPGSPTPAQLAGRLRNLVSRRDQHPQRAVAGHLRGWLTGATGLRRGSTREVDEYSRADKQALIRAAWADLHTVEQRLQRGQQLLAAGVDPGGGGWLEPANLLWAIDNATATRDILTRLPQPEDWPPTLRDLLPAATPPSLRRRALMRGLVRMLYPHNLDLHPFRILLMAATGHTSEEITSLTEADAEFTPDGVLLTFTKNRAHAQRRRTYTGGPPEPGAPGELAGLPYPARPRLDTPAILRRLLAATARLRARSGLTPAPLFLRAVVHGHDLTIRPFHGDMNGASFGVWLGQAGLELTGPADIRRLRKSGKVEKALAYRGRISDIADDHTVEVFAGHYAHGTTLHVIAGHVITSAQQRWFTQATDGPTVLTPAAETALTGTHAATVLGLTGQQVEQLRAGAMDMGVAGCRDPLNSPFGRPGDPCPVAPLRCLECRHAIVLPSNLPQLLLLADHLDQLRLRLPPMHFHALWGHSHANLTAVLADRTDAEISLARSQIAAGQASLHLPLSAQVEFDR